MGQADIAPSNVADTTSSSGLSATWVGQAAGLLKVSMSTGFGEADTFVTSTVTLQNIGAQPLYEVDWMRSVDPDQEQVSGLADAIDTAAPSYMCHRTSLCRWMTASLA
jgi:hypothetical protein